MRRYQVGAAAAVATAGGYAALYRLGQTWGATEEEQRQALAGDELLPGARAWTSHAITIQAPAAVWPWLVQMGWGRAGWYTYRWVDRLLQVVVAPVAVGVQVGGHRVEEPLEVGHLQVEGPHRVQHGREHWVVAGGAAQAGEEALAPAAQGGRLAGPVQGRARSSTISSA